MTVTVSFVAFKKAFDMVDRTVIREILRYYHIPQEIVKILKRLYEDIGCRVYNANFPVPFNVNTGVRQGCMYLVPTRLVASNRMGDENNNGWTLQQKLEDLDFSNES